MAKVIISCLAALALLPSPAAAARAGDARDARRQEKVLARLKKARGENRRVVIRFRDEASVTGRVGELRERGFTFEPDNEDDALELRGRSTVAGVLYEDVRAVRYPSKGREFFKGVRYGLLGAGGTVVFLPYATVMAVLGREVCC